MQMKKRKPKTPVVLKNLLPSERIDQEMVIGGYPFSEADTTAALKLPSKENLLRGVRLTVSEPSGHRLTNRRLVRRISRELEHLFGGWFVCDLVPYIQLYDNLVSQEIRDQYCLEGMDINWDEPQTAFYFLSFSVASWQVQAVGEPEVFHCIFLGKLLTKAEVLREEGYPHLYQMKPLPFPLAEAVPKLSIHRLTNSSSRHASNVFDMYLEGHGFNVKTGLRMRLMEDGSEFPGEKSYFYGIRINCSLN
jgi:hypothetical protein